MSTQRLLCVVSIALLVACSSGKKRTYQSVADAANPAIAKLRGIVGAVLAPDPDERTVVAACLNAEDGVRELQDVDFHDQDLNSKIGHTEAGAVIRSLIEMRRDECMEDTGDGTRTHRCRNWCVERWARLADALDRLHAAAASDGVAIEQLRVSK